MPYNPGAAMRRVTIPRATKFFDGLGVGDRQIRVIASDATPDRMGDILEPSGARLANFRRNPVVLAQHDSSQPIATAPSIAVDGDQLVALIEFPPAGVNARSDEYLALMKAGVISAVSVGFLPIERVPLNGGGFRFTVWELLEISCVSVPANPAALVTERSFDTRGYEDRLRRAAEIRQSLAGPAARAAADHDYEQLDYRIAAARARHREFEERRNRAAAIDAVALMVQW